MVADALRVEPYVTWRLLQQAWIASDAQVEETLEADDADLEPRRAGRLCIAGRRVLRGRRAGDVLRVLPLLRRGLRVAKHTLRCLEEMPFDTGGHLWFFGVEQTYHALAIALVMQLAIILLNESNFGAWPAVGGLPILGL